MLGESAIADGKLLSASPIPILGLSVLATHDGFECWPTAEKVAKWLSKIKAALSSNVLPLGGASKLAAAFS